MVTRVIVRNAESAPHSPTAAADGSAECRAELSGDLLDEQGQVLDSLICFAFDVLGARYLDVRVVPTGAT